MEMKLGGERRSRLSLNTINFFLSFVSCSYPSQDMLTHPGLPLDLVDPRMEVMKVMLPSEREFIRVIAEIIIEYWSARWRWWTCRGTHRHGDLAGLWHYRIFEQPYFRMHKIWYDDKRLGIVATKGCDMIWICFPHSGGEIGVMCWFGMCAWLLTLFQSRLSLLS
jgi:hypothetical protein